MKKKRCSKMRKMRKLRGKREVEQLRKRTIPVFSIE